MIKIIKATMLTNVFMSCQKNKKKVLTYAEFWWQFSIYFLESKK